MIYTIGLSPLSSLSLFLSLSPLSLSLVWAAIFVPLHLHHLPGKKGGGVCDAEGQRSKLHATPDKKDDW